MVLHLGNTGRRNVLPPQLDRWCPDPFGLVREQILPGKHHAPSPSLGTNGPDRLSEGGGYPTSPSACGSSSAQATSVSRRTMGHGALPTCPPHGIAAMERMYRESFQDHPHSSLR